MGDPRRLRRKYTTPAHPWQKENIESEKAIKNEYALKNKQEIWKMNSILRNFKNQAKKLIALRTAQAEKERNQLIQRLTKLGLIKTGAKLDDILSLTLKDIFERRLQSVLFRKGFARSMKQARQFIIHNHVTISDQKITSPSYLVAKSEEENVSFSTSSSFIDVEHPERTLKPVAPASDKKSGENTKKQDEKTQEDLTEKSDSDDSDTDNIVDVKEDKE